MLLLSTIGRSQVLPSDGAHLHYRIIGFSVPMMSENSHYELQIAMGTIKSEKNFVRKVIMSVTGTGNRVVAEVPHFGADYTWRVIFKDAPSGKKSTELYHFSTLQNDTLSRLRVIDTATAYKDAYVFLDFNSTLYNMKGEPVWFLPEAVLDGEQERTVLDLKANNSGTITFFSGEGHPYDINYNGEILWCKKLAAEQNMLSENCHHEFTKLSNGLYMTLETETCYWLLPGRTIKANATFTAADSTEIFQQLNFGAVSIYDSMQKNVWSWKCSDYFRHSDIHERVTPEGTFDADVHLNSAFFDEKRGFIYLSFKNINRILKVKYPEGTVASSYGPKSSVVNSNLENDMFCGQHSCKVNDDDELYVFNNNYCHTPSFPHLVIMKQPTVSTGDLEIIWDYDCKIADMKEADGPGLRFGKGGNIIQLPGRSVFASMNLPYSKVMIVARDKKILWGALAERWDAEKKEWTIAGLYRASIVVDRQGLERLIWSLKKTTFVAGD